MRLALLAGLCAWAGSALLLSRLRWFSRPPLVERLRPYATVPSDANPRRGLWSVASFRDAIVPLATATGGRVAAVFGVDEDAGTRLTRVHSPLATSAFRVRQLTSAAGGLAIGLLVATAIGIAAIGALCIVGLPLLGFLVPEQRLASESDDWRRRTFLELPVVAEQLGMLLSAGYSLGGALNRLAARGKGCCGRHRILDLRSLVQASQRLGQQFLVLVHSPPLDVINPGDCPASWPSNGQALNR